MQEPEERRPCARHPCLEAHTNVETHDNRIDVHSTKGAEDV
ncbi:hypothetical protein BN874_720020 [Candidatus Contendobacter odensis Run_B_J11]|uniref:Uncharacterized protein n=1 Tax=Candidatus Contendobacter odensis Run_B_J11 TaxID=1400861 RepID=A0A7U7J4B6_9GAMM|nr:hypothetical protein BN874_720020 [Candidatus Contendobacter odensis Run_B_J11]